MRQSHAERLAVEIFGPGRVLGYRSVSRVQKARLPTIEPVMLFSEDVLRECAEANTQGIANWRLAYVVGRTLHQEWENMGSNQKRQPCFHPDWNWWLEQAQDSWATAPVKPGYRLFDFTKRFAPALWGDQETSIAQLGEDFERAEEQAVTEICFSNFLLTSGKERLMTNWYHWGKLQTPNGGHFYVGHFDWHGFVVYDGSDDLPRDSIGVVVARKPPQ